MSRSLVQFGAGNIGRSFIGQLFARAGYEVVFVDVDDLIIEALNRRGAYSVIVKSDEEPDRAIEVTGVRAVHAEDLDAVARELQEATYVATAVGAGALPKLAPAIVSGLKRRAGRPFDIIIAENVRDAAGILEHAIRSRIQSESDEPATGDQLRMPGLVQTSIGKMVPIMSEADRAEDPLRVFAEPYNTLIVDRNGFIGGLPEIPNLKPVEDIDAYVDRKLFIHNLGHATCAYLGFQFDPSLTFIYQAISKPEIHGKTKRAMEEAACALIEEYPEAFTKKDLEDHIDDLLRRFANSALGDTIYRVGRDLKRKLSREDRLIGAMRLCARHTCSFETIADAAAAGFRFRATDENGRLYPVDREVALDMERAPVSEVVQSTCGLDTTDPTDARLLTAVINRL
jgi:mannitol-1-phosphate 5-dehydrogenase